MESNMEHILFSLAEAYDFFWNKIKTHENYTFLRYGDGERALMCAETVSAQEGWKAGAELTEVGRKLWETLTHLDKKVWYGISCPCCDARAYFWYLKQIKSTNISFANMWVNINYERFKRDFVKLHRDAVVIANYRAEKKKIGYLRIIRQYSIDDDCIGFWEREGEDFLQRIISETKELKDTLFVVSAGPLAEIIISGLYKSNPENCYIDFGSALDFLIHDKITRPFMIKGHELSSKNCWMYQKEKIKTDIDVVLTTYKRPDCLRQQLNAIKEQTLPPKHIYLYQDGIDSYYKIVLDEAMLQEFDDTRIAVDNNGVWGRFEYAREIVSSTYVCIFDDDTIPGKRWLENCFMQMQQEEGIYGTNGILLSDKDEYPRGNDDKRIGWNNPNFKTVMVDFVGHSWFLKTEWLTFMLEDTSRIREKYKYVGEDMYLSYKCNLHGINTYVPPHPNDAPKLWGSLPGYGKKYGMTNVAVSASSLNFWNMNEVLKDLRKCGWKIVCERKKDYYDQIVAESKENKIDRYEYILQRLRQLWSEEKKIFLYGAGGYGKLFLDYIKQCGLRITGFVVSDISRLKVNVYQNEPVIGVDELLESQADCIVLLTLNEFFHDEIREKLKEKSYLKVYPTEDDGVVYEELLEALRIFSVRNE